MGRLASRRSLLRHGDGHVKQDSVTRMGSYEIPSPSLRSLLQPCRGAAFNQALLHPDCFSGGVRVVVCGVMYSAYIQKSSYVSLERRDAVILVHCLNMRTGTSETPK